MRLISVELKRFRSRRLVWITAVGLLVILGFTLLQSFVSSVPPSGAELAEMEQAYQDDVQYWEENGEKDKAACLESQELDRIDEDDPTLDYGCDQMGPPDRDEFFGTGQYGWRTNFESDAAFSLTFFALPALAAAVLIGASFMSAEIGTGALGNWLTFEPRRTRVFFSKAAGLSLGVLPITVVLLLLWFGGSLAVYAINGAVGTPSADLWESLIWTGVRIALFSVAAALGGFALATLTKSAAATLGVLFGYMVVLETALQSFKPGWQPWLISVNIRAFLDGGTEYAYEDCAQVTSDMQCEWVEKQLEFSSSLIYFAVLLSVAVVAAWLVFRRRDVN